MDPRSREWPAQWGAQLDRAGGGRRFNRHLPLFLKILILSLMVYLLADHQNANHLGAVLT